MNVNPLDVPGLEAAEESAAEESTAAEVPAAEARESHAAAHAAAHAHARSRLNTAVAATVALLATFMAICNVKDGNIVQAMQQAQADKIDQWNFYQARNIREEVGKAVVAELTVLASSRVAGGAPSSADSVLAAYRAFVAQEDRKKQHVRTEAERQQRLYDALNYRDDQFDVAEALLALAVSMLAVTSLTQKRWLYWLAMVPIALGGLMGLAGLVGWHVHSDLVATLLS